MTTASCVVRINVVFTPLLLSLVARAELGRVSSLVNAVSQTATLLSIAASASIVSDLLNRLGSFQVLGIRSGPVDTIFLGCGLLCLLGGGMVLLRVARPRPVATAATKA